MKKIKFIVIILFIINLAVPFCVSGQTQFKQPENMKEAKQLGEDAFQAARSEGPDAIKKVWTDEALPIWKKMFYWAKTTLWDSWLKSWLEDIRTNIVNFIKGEVSERKPQVEEEFQKEKQELKQEAPGAAKTIWQKLMELIR